MTGRLQRIFEVLGRLGPAWWALVLGLSGVLVLLWPGWLGRTVATIAGLVALLALLHGGVGQRVGRWLARPVRKTSASLRRSDLVAEILCPLIVLGVVLGLFHQLFEGDAPLRADHPLHLFNGWVMADHLLPTGRLSGWVHDRGAGFPAGVLYPVGSSLLLALVRFCLPSSVSWEMVYGVGFVSAMACCQLAMYFAGRSIAGPWAGLLAALLSAVDQGAYRQGGYAFSVDIGVWPISLSMSSALLAIVLLHRSLDRPGSRVLPLVALLIGAAIITHPMSMAFLGLAIPLLVVHAALEAERRSPLVVAGRGLLTAALGGAVAGFWLLPFLAFRQYSLVMGTGSMPLAGQASGVVQFDFFTDMWGVPAALALVGGVAAWRRQLPGARFLTLLFAFIALAVNGNTILALELDRWWPRLASLQPLRFYLYLRPIAFLLAGVGGVWVLRRAGQVFADQVRGSRRWVLRVLACVVFGAFLVPVAEAVFWEEVSPRGQWRGRPDGYRHFREVCDFIREHAAARAGEHRGFVRSTWPSTCPGWAGGGSHCFESSPVFTGIGHVHPSWHSAATFQGLFGFRGHGSSMQMLRSLGVRYLVTTGSRRDAAEIFRSGELRVFEVTDVADGPYTVIGQARVRLESYEDERIRFSVQGAAADDRLTLYIPFFPNWHAAIDGREVPLRETPVVGIASAMSLPLANGALELRYERGRPEHVGGVVTILALLICLLLAVRWWPAPVAWRVRCGGVAARGAAWVSRRRGVLLAATVVLALLVVALVGVRVSSRFRSGRPRFDTVVDFDRATVWYLEGGSRERCHRTWTEDWRCGPERHKLVGPRYSWTNMGGPHGAIYAHPFRDAELHIDFPDVRLGTSLEGGLGIAHSGGGRAKVVLQIRAGDRPICERTYVKGSGWDTFRCDTRELAGTVARLGFVVTAKKNNRRQLLFRAWTADGEPPPAAPARAASKIPAPPDPDPAPDGSGD